MKKTFTQLTVTYSDGFKIVEVCVHGPYAAARLETLIRENVEDIDSGMSSAYITKTELVVV